MEKMRKDWLDAVKTVAIFIVLLNHAKVVIPGVNFWGGMFYVPVFFVLAGFTYRTKDITYKEFIKAKAKRLLLPYLTANLFYLVFFALKERILDGRFHTVGWQSLIGILYARNQLYLSAKSVPEKNVFFLQLQNAPTWFLPALFISLIVFDGLMRLFGADLKKTGLCISIGLFFQFFYHYSSPVLLPWSLDAVPFFAALLEVGYSIRKTDFLEKTCRDKKASLFCLAAGTVFVLTALWNGSANLSIGEYGKSMIIGLYNAVGASFLIMLLCYRAECGGRRSYLSRVLYKPGKYTLTILCYHLFVFLFLQSGIAVLCEKAGIREDSVIVCLLRLGMILVTIAGISCAGSILNRIRERKRIA